MDDDDHRFVSTLQNTYIKHPSSRIAPTLLVPSPHNLLGQLPSSEAGPSSLHITPRRLHNDIRNPALPLSQHSPPLPLSSRLLHPPPRNLQPLLLSSQLNPRSLVRRGLRLLAHNTRTPPRAMQDYPETLRNLRPSSPRRTQQGRLPRSLHHARRILRSQVRQEPLL